MQRKQITSGTHWETQVGYSRAVRVGNQIFVAGTTATDASGQLVGRRDPYAQTVQALKNVETALVRIGSSLKDVVRTRIYVTNINNWEAIGRAHKNTFRHIQPVTTMVEVNSLINPEMLVEIEVDAVISE